MAESEFADEGEGGADELIDARPSVNGKATGLNPYSIRGRIKYAWRLLRNKSVAEILTADPAEQIKNARAQQDYRWRGIYALVLLLAMTLQIAFADWIFWKYLEKNEYDIPQAVFIAFFSSVVVEVIGLVLVVTQSLFPRRATEATAGSWTSSR